jgi:hypothetical protein
MTVAVDRKTGAVVGQVLETFPTGLVAILTRYGYKTVLAASVRLEETE